MPSELGRFVHQRRLELELSIRRLAERVGCSPTLVVLIEKEDTPPASEDTLRSLAVALEVEPDQLFALAGRLPQDLAPSSPREIALYRRIRAMSPKQQAEVLEELKRKRKRRR